MSFDFNILITGSSGFIGSHLVNHFVRLGYKCVCIDISHPGVDFSDEYTFYNIDICDFESLNSLFCKYKFKYVFNLAAITHLSGNSLVSYNCNTEGVLNISKLCRIFKSHLFSFSTQLVVPVGFNPSSPFVYKPDTIYGLSKSIGEYIVRSSGCSWTILRPTTVWGPLMTGHLHSLMKFLALGKYIHPSRSKSFKYFSFVSNLTFQVSSLLSLPSTSYSSKVFYLCDYEPIEIYSFVSSLSHGLRPNSSLPFRVPSLIAYLIANIFYLFSIFGFSKPYTILSHRRINNICTSYPKPFSTLESLIPSLPFSFTESVRATTSSFFLSRK